jgi:hypothetical protein
VLPSIYDPDTWLRCATTTTSFAFHHRHVTSVTSHHNVLYLKAVSALSLLAGLAFCAAVPVARNALLGTWSTLPNITLNGLQYPRQEYSVVLLGDDMYVLGGILPFDGTIYPTVNIVQKFNFITNTWTEVAAMPAALNHVNVAVVKGMIYYLGGLAVTATGGPAYWNASGRVPSTTPLPTNGSFCPICPRDEPLAARPLWLLARPYISLVAS